MSGLAVLSVRSGWPVPIRFDQIRQCGHDCALVTSCFDSYTHTYFYLSSPFLWQSWEDIILSLPVQCQPETHTHTHTLVFIS